MITHEERAANLLYLRREFQQGQILTYDILVDKFRKAFYGEILNNAIRKDEMIIFAKFCHHDLNVELGVNAVTGEKDE